MHICTYVYKYVYEYIYEKCLVAFFVPSGAARLRTSSSPYAPPIRRTMPPHAPPRYKK